VAISAVSQSFFPYSPVATSELGWVIVTVFGRMLMIFYACSSLTAIGIQELLASARVRDPGE
jgi:hypothetical protein